MGCLRVPCPVWAIALALVAGSTASAAVVVERVLAMLSERDLLFTADIPEVLDRERRLLAAEHDRALKQLAGLSAEADEESRAEIEDQLEDVRLRRDDLQARIRAASPRLASLRSPEPLDLEATRQALEPGTLVLAYVVGRDASYLFVVGRSPDHLGVHRLDASEDGLRRSVRRLRNALCRSPESADARRIAARLSGLLLAPAAAEIAVAKRLLILPDGPLSLLPFAALADPGSPDRFLLESTPVAVAASATVFAQLKAERRRRDEVRVVAFGDPAYPGAAGEVPGGLRSAMRDVLLLEPLAATRGEVEALRDLFEGTVTVWVGSDATEERAKDLGRDVGIVHFACHGLVDEEFPLESALALSVPGEDRVGVDIGVLQAWEIFEELRLDADLVTLSACETALGREVAGEGIVGLTRAFQYAGARSVVASLWSVADASTARLMERFYDHLESGQSKAEALLAAQQELLKGPLAMADGSLLDASHPFYWAPFVLVGDWW